MTHIIVGTAGHIDHGTTSLVRALTGIDTDRLDEEKRRGISIELGFAHLDLAKDLRAGFVDVPGHERFVKNMLAGVGGIDIALLVIAADESIKPQTREHFDICRLLAIPHGIVAITKTDAVDPDIAGLVRLEAEEFVAGSFLEGAPIVSVSAKTGAGLDDLKAAIRDMARSVKTKDASRHFRLPVDRSFSMKGFGAVATGTLVSGSVKLEQELEVHPGGARVRARGIQVHGAQVKMATAGQRTAINLAGIDSADLHRGMVLAEAGRFQPTTVIDTAFDLLPGAKPLKNRAPIHFHAGTAEIEGTVRPLDGRDALPPGQSGFVRIRLRDPILLLPGDRFIARMFSPVVTIGGGHVLDVAPPRKGEPDRLKVLKDGSIADRVGLLVRESKYGVSVADLIRRTGLLAAEIEQSGVLILKASQAWAADPAWFRNATESIRDRVKAFHKDSPLLPGIAKEDLRGRQLPGAPPFLLDAMLAETKDVVQEGETVRLRSHTLHLKQDEEAALAKIEAAFAEAGLAVPAVGEVLAKSGVEAARAKSLLQILLRQRRLVRISEDLTFHGSALTQLRELLAARKGESLSVPAFKDLTGISRKYAIPLLEFLDRERVTRREGDARIVL